MSIISVPILIPDLYASGTGTVLIFIFKQSFVHLKGFVKGTQTTGTSEIEILRKPIFLTEATTFIEKKDKRRAYKNQARLKGD